MIKAKNLLYKIINKDDDNKVINEKTILNDFNIHIEKGDFVAILGHNGSGKTTFAKHLNALLMPNEGNIIVNGKDTKVIDELWKIRKDCGMVFQNPDNQIVGTTVEEDVAFGPENLGLESKKIIKRVDEALEKTEMTKYRLKSPNHLSGGQKQRVAIASSLAMRPQCIVLDEPTAMLDPKGRQEVMEMVTKLNEEENMTIILITHHMEEAARAKRVVIMEKGKAILDGTPKEVFTKIDDIKRLGLEIPPIMDLAYRLFENGKLSRYDVFDIEEFVLLCMDEGLGCKESLKNKLVIEETKSDAVQTKNIEVLRFDNVSYMYEAGTNMEVVAVNDVSLIINRNEFIGIIGHTGSGKSTILQLMNGLIGPTTGNVFYKGKTINSNKRDLHFNVGLVFQYPESQLFEETIIKDVMFGPLNKGLTEKEARKVAKEALEFLGMGEEYYHSSPFELSGGEMRKVAIAGVIAMEPEIIILDEPVAGLDPANKKYLLDSLKILQKDKNKTIIIVSHDMNDVAKYSDRLIVMDEGKIIFDDDTRKVFRNKNELRRVGLEVPDVTKAISQLGNDDYTILTVEEAVECLS
ncbi:MAG: energy-coupling factor transporter ATPase [Lachnospiraceae bacterium]|nr:energy-coupling factor transporter ATPase [Lachnospiraceae bacterium]